MRTSTSRKARRSGIIGESGSGKSTLVRLLLALDVPTAGTVEFDGRLVDAAAGARSLHWLRRETGIVFQDPYASLDPSMSVGRIIAEPLWALGIEGDRRAACARCSKTSASSRRWPTAFRTSSRAGSASASRWRAPSPIARGCSSATSRCRRWTSPSAPRSSSCSSELRVRDGLTLVLVSHDIGVVQNLCDEVIVMKDGRIVEEGPTEKVLLQPQVAYTRRLLASIPAIDPGSLTGARVGGAG